MLRLLKECAERKGAVGKGGEDVREKETGGRPIQG